MNVKINKEKFDKLLEKGNLRYAIGSRLYNTTHVESDIDILVVVPVSKETENNMIFQYKEDIYDYTIVDEDTFLNKAKSGDDPICFEAYYSEGHRDFNLPKVVRAYSGLAFRDLKECKRDGKSEEYSVRKLYHALRCQFIAESLIESGEVDLSRTAKSALDFIDDPSQDDLDILVPRILRLRAVLKGVDSNPKI